MEKKEKTEKKKNKNIDHMIGQKRREFFLCCVTVFLGEAE